MLHLLRPEYRTKHVTKVIANSIGELADKMEGVDKPQLLKTIRAYNAAVKTDAPFNPNIKDGRSADGLPVPRSNWANPIVNPPFHAYAITCGVTFTFGGVRISNDGEVVNTNHRSDAGALRGRRGWWAACSTSTTPAPRA